MMGGWKYLPGDSDEASVSLCVSEGTDLQSCQGPIEMATQGIDALCLPQVCL